MVTKLQRRFARKKARAQKFKTQASTAKRTSTVRASGASGRPRAGRGGSAGVVRTVQSPPPRISTPSFTPRVVSTRPQPQPRSPFQVSTANSLQGEQFSARGEPLFDEEREAIDTINREERGSEDIDLQQSRLVADLNPDVRAKLFSQGGGGLVSVNLFNRPFKSFGKREPSPDIVGTQAQIDQANSINVIRKATGQPLVTVPVKKARKGEAREFTNIFVDGRPVSSGFGLGQLKTEFAKVPDPQFTFGRTALVGDRFV